MARARVELVGSRSHTRGARTIFINEPFDVTDPAEIEYFRGKRGLFTVTDREIDKKVSESSEPEEKAGPTEEPQPEKVDDAEPDAGGVPEDPAPSVTEPAPAGEPDGGGGKAGSVGSPGPDGGATRKKKVKIGDEK